MQFKRGDKVKFLGGNFPIGIKEGTDEFLGAVLPALPVTFVWDAIQAGEDKLYVIQHNQGSELENFKNYSSYFGKIDYDFLKESKKYLLVHEAALKVVEPSKQSAPQPKPEPKPAPTQQEEVYNEEEIIQSSPIIEDAVEEAPVEPITQEEEVYQEQPTVGVYAPHFTTETCPTDRMMNAVTKSVMVKSMKMTEPFTLDGVNGVEQGRAGDFLILTQNNYLYIHPKEGFDESYEYCEGLIPLQILGKTFNIMPEVAEYIDKLQVTNSVEEPINESEAEEQPRELTEEEVMWNQFKSEEEEKILDELSVKIGSEGKDLHALCSEIVNKYPEIRDISFKKELIEEDGERRYVVKLFVGDGGAYLEIG